MKRSRFEKRLVVLLLAVTLVLSSFSFAFAVEEESDIFELTILHTNDIHGRIDAGIGFPRLATIVNEFRAENDNVLLLDAGDTVHGRPLVNLSQGESVIELMNAIGYDYMTAGNHDFNYGYEQLIKLNELADFPIFAGNVIDEDTKEPIIDKTYDIITFDDITIAIFGIATPETTFKSHPKNTEGLEFIDPVVYAGEMVGELEAYSPDFVIALTHLGMDDSTAPSERSTTIAQEVSGIDLIVDGHSHHLLEEGYMVGDTLIVQAGEYLGSLGVVKLVVDGDDVEWIAGIYDYDEDAVDENEEILAMLDAIKAERDEIYNVVIGTNLTRLDGEREIVRTQESNLGNLITDAMLYSSGADVAFTNGGGIRASIEVGEITVGHVADVLPFGNLLYVVELSGADLVAALEHGTDEYPEPKGAFPHVAGMSYKIDPDAEAGQRVHSVMIGDEPIDPEKMYHVATNDFVAAGGDDYTMVGEAETVAMYNDLAEVVVEFIEELGEVDYGVEGRILVEAYSDEPVDDDPVDEDPVDEDPVAEDPEDEDDEETSPPTGDDSVILYVLLAGASLVVIVGSRKKHKV